MVNDDRSRDRKLVTAYRRHYEGDVSGAVSSMLGPVNPSDPEARAVRARIDRMVGEDYATGRSPDYEGIGKR